MHDISYLIHLMSEFSREGIETAKIFLIEKTFAVKF